MHDFMEKYLYLFYFLFGALTGILITYIIKVILDYRYNGKAKELEKDQKEAILYAERERISQDLHDGTMQDLYGIGLRLQYIDTLLKEYDNKAVKEQLDYTLQKINQTSKEIRAYITDLRAQYENKDLAQEVKGIIEGFISETNIQVAYDFNQQQQISISPNVIAQVLFIIKEALNNIRKHAQASIVNLNITIGGSKLTINIRDNGQGFDCHDGRSVEKVNEGLGLKSIAKRVREMKGTIGISSNKGAGTDIEIIIPLEVGNG